MNTCKNCENDFEGNFCNNCGQKLITKRFTLKESIFWIFTSIFNYDQGFLHTSKELIIRPGEVINAFINGRTIRYAHPFRFLFIWATLSAIIGVYFNIYEESGIAVNEMAGYSEEQLEYSRKMFKVMKEYMSFVLMAMIPFMALGTYLISRKKKLNFTEHIIMVAYGNSSSIIIGFPVLLAHFFIKDIQLLSTINMVLAMLVMGRVIAKTLNDNLFVGILKYLFSFLIAMISSMIVGVIFVLIYAITAKILGLGNLFPTS